LIRAWVSKGRKIMARLQVGEKIDEELGAETAGGTAVAKLARARSWCINLRPCFAISVPLFQETWHPGFLSMRCVRMGTAVICLRLEHDGGECEEMRLWNF
jgi:hypothetical protein